MTHADIIARLTAATGPDRELDAEIDIHLFGGETIWKTANYTMDQYPASRRASSNHVGGFANEHVPLVTASLDACLALIERVLPGWHLELTTTGFRPGASLFPGTAVSGHGAYAATPALALLLALFRALEAQEPTMDKALEAAVQATRHHSFNALTMDEHRDIVREAITAYLSALPVNRAVSADHVDDVCRPAYPHAATP